MQTAPQTLGQLVGSFKGSRELVRDRHAFLKRSAGKLDDAKLERLEQTAARFGMFVEYGAYPHLKLEDGGQEIAAVQDWTTLTLVFLRPSYDRKEELLTAISQALA